MTERASRGPPGPGRERRGAPCRHLVLRLALVLSSLLVAATPAARADLDFRDLWSLGRMGHRMAQLRAGFVADLEVGVEVPGVDATRPLRLEISRGLEPGMWAELRGPRPSVALLVDMEALWMTVSPEGAPTRSFVLEVEGLERATAREEGGLRSLQRVPSGFLARGRIPEGTPWSFEILHDPGYQVASMALELGERRRYRVEVRGLEALVPRLSRPVSLGPFLPLGEEELAGLPPLVRVLLGVEEGEPAELLAGLRERVRRLRGALDRSWKQRNRRERMGHGE